MILKDELAFEIAVIKNFLREVNYRNVNTLKVDDEAEAAYFSDES